MALSPVAAALLLLLGLAAALLLGLHQAVVDAAALRLLQLAAVARLLLLLSCLHCLESPLATFVRQGLFVVLG